MPSAMVIILSSRAIAPRARLTRPAAGSSGMPWVKDMSSLTPFTGRSRRYDNGETPVPKSSSRMGTPAERKVVSSCRILVLGSTRLDSVSSTTSRLGATWYRAMSASRRAANSPSPSWSAETFTETHRVWSLRRARYSIAVPTTRVPSGTARPRSSATPRNTSGSRMPRVGCRRQLGLEAAPRAAELHHGAVVHLGPAAPARLRAVQRGVGGREQHGCAALHQLGVGQRDPDARPNRDPPTTEPHRLLEPRVDARGDLEDHPLALDVVQHDDELVAAEPGDGPAPGGRGAQDTGHVHEHEVSRRVPVAVIDDLELVQVAHQHRDPVDAPGLLENGLQHLLEQGAVGETGQRVAHRAMHDPLTGLANRTLLQ